MLTDRFRTIPDRIFALATLGIVIALDVVTTMMALDLGSYEANPFVRPFTDSLAELAVFKFGVFAIFAIPTLVLKVDAWTKWIWVVAGVHGVVVCLNLWGVWRLGGFGW